MSSVSSAEGTDVSTGATGVTEVAPEFSNALTLSPSGGTDSAVLSLEGVGRSFPAERLMPALFIHRFAALITDSLPESLIWVKPKSYNNASSATSYYLCT